MKAGILIFPGTNCDIDLKRVLEEEYQADVDLLWHSNSFDVKHDIYFVPGGFSYGDYLRSGAMSSRALSIDSLQEAVKKEVLTVGICNGFQILTESNILLGALIKNKTLKHVCKWAELEPQGFFNNKIPQKYALPVSHSEGNFLCSDDELKLLEDNNRILFKYKENFNGSTASIAGISSANKRVLGLMPHPERAVFEQMDTQKEYLGVGKLFFDFIFNQI